jgi:hypothetical protein
VALCAFDLLELDGRNLRSTPLEDRKCALARLVGKPRPGIMLNATFEEPGDIVFKHACALVGCYLPPYGPAKAGLMKCFMSVVLRLKSSWRGWMPWSAAEAWSFEAVEML